jgi:hypothetical protein
MFAQKIKQSPLAHLSSFNLSNVQSVSTCPKTLPCKASILPVVSQRSPKEMPTSIEGLREMAYGAKVFLGDAMMLTPVVTRNGR